MKRNIDTLLADTLFNTNVRPSTRKKLLLSSLKAIGTEPNAFEEALEQEASNEENIDGDQRERDRNPTDVSLGLKEKELRLLRGEGLQNP